MTTYLPYFTDPAIGQGVSNLAAAFAPPDPLQQAQIGQLEAERGLLNMQMQGRQQARTALGQGGFLNEGGVDQQGLADLMAALALFSDPGEYLPTYGAYGAQQIADPRARDDALLATLISQGVSPDEDTSPTSRRADEVFGRNQHGELSEIFAKAQADQMYPDPGDFDRDTAREALMLATGFGDDDTIIDQGASNALAFMRELVLGGAGYDEAAASIAPNFESVPGRPGGSFWGLAAGPRRHEYTGPRNLAEVFGDNAPPQVTGTEGSGDLPSPTGSFEDPAPLPPRGTPPVDGQVYQTRNGPARWDAATQTFEPVAPRM